MKLKNRLFTRSLALLLAAVLTVGMLPAQAAAEDAENQIEETTVLSEDLEDYLADAVLLREQTIENPNIDPNWNQPETVDSLDGNGNCALKDGNYVRYIDRVDVPQWAIDWYNLMIEGGDNDGENDFLINQVTDDGSTIVPFVIYENVPLSELQDYDSDFWTEYDADTAYFRAAYQAFDRDYPEVFWRNSMSTRFYSSENEDGTYTLMRAIDITQGFANDYTVETVKEDIAIRDARVEELVSAAPEGTANKVKYFSEWLVENNNYNSLVRSGSTYNEVANNSVWECISALKGLSGEAGPVCEAFARAMKVLCDAAGIPCVLVDGANHMWNYIEVNDIWYAQDTTWNDTRSSGTRGINDYTLVGGDSVQHGKTFLTSHPVKNQWYTNGTMCINGPVLNSISYCFTLDAPHNPGEAVMTHADPTCTNTGYDQTTICCTACDSVVSTQTTTIAALGHVCASSVVTDPTCTEAGYTTNVCSRCGETYITDETEALGHDYASVVTDSTCTAGGYTTYTCTRCGDSYVGDYTDALGHDYTSVVTDPTCTAQGYTTYTCTRCGDSYVGDYTDALGHDYLSEVIKEPTTEEAGVRGYLCSRCHDFYTETIDKLTMKKPTVSISAAALSTTRKVTMTGTLQDYANIAEYYPITAHGIVYMTTSRLGSRELTFATTGRTRVTFGAYKADGSFCYTIRTASTTTSYTVRAFVTYTDADGSSVTVYSDPLVYTYSDLKNAG